MIGAVLSAILLVLGLLVVALVTVVLLAIVVAWLAESTRG